MQEVKQVSVSTSNIILGNKYLANSISTKVDLVDLWPKIVKYTDLIVRVTVTIPVIEAGLSKNMILDLDGVYKVNTFEADKLYVTFTANFPGEIDTSNGKEVVAVANIVTYNVL